MGKPKNKRGDQSYNGDSSRQKNKRQRQEHQERQHGVNNRKRKRKKGFNGNGNRRGGGFGPKYWIEDCKDSKPGSGNVEDSDMIVKITRIELMDNDDIDNKEVSSTGIDQCQVASLLEVNDAAAVTVKSTTTTNEQQHKSSDILEYPNSITDEKKGEVVSAEENLAQKSSSVVVAMKGETIKNNTREGNCDNNKIFVAIQRDDSAKGSPKKPPNFHLGYKPLPNGDCGDGIVNPYPSDEVADKYWAQRRRLFKRFDEGIQLDEQGWYSVTPEVIANHIAKRLAVLQQHRVPSAEEPVSTGKSGGEPRISSPSRNLILLDAFCGCGGNAIAFAKKDEISKILCVDTDREKLRMAAHNAEIYKIPTNKLLFIEADACCVMKSYKNGKKVENDKTTQENEKANTSIENCHGYSLGGVDLLPNHLDAIFLSPPWGGMHYEKVGRRNYDVAKCIKVSTKSINGGRIDTDIIENEDNGPDGNGSNKNVTSIDGEQLLKIASDSLSANRKKAVMYFLPRNTNGVALGRSALKAGYTGTLELEQNVLEGKLKAVTAYFGFDE